MLLLVTFACLLPMTTTEAQYGLSPGATPHYTDHAHTDATHRPTNETTGPTTDHNTDRAHTDATDRPAAAALDVSTHAANYTRTSTAHNEKPSTPRAESKKASQSTLNETTGPTTGPTTDHNNDPSSTVRDGTTASNTETTAPTMVLSTTSTLMSPILTRSSTTQPESAVMTDGPLKLTTRGVPTAKLSATTETSFTKWENSTDSAAQKQTTVPMTTTKPAVVVTKKDTPISSDGENNDQVKAFRHGKIVAGIIGAALLAMMIGFLVILYKQHKLRKHQVATMDWAGPTPFLETGSENNGHVTLRSANRISLSSFLPQRLSKRLTLLAESREEMQDTLELTTPTTFAGKEERKVEKNGTQAAKSEMSAKEAAVDKSEAPTKAEDVVVVVDEVSGDGEVKDKEDQAGQAEVAEGENGESESAPAAEEPPKLPNDENEAETGKEGAD